MLGWEPRTALSEGLKMTIAYFDKVLAKGDESSAALRRAV
jgi:hypothetical protein